MILLNSDTGLSMSLGETAIITEAGCEAISHAPAICWSRRAETGARNRLARVAKSSRGRCISKSAPTRQQFSKVFVSILSESDTYR
jgi:hypothetical protein